MNGKAVSAPRLFGGQIEMLPFTVGGIAGHDLEFDEVGGMRRADPSGVFGQSSQKAATRPGLGNRKV